jgi:hypothetical protein
MKLYEKEMYTDYAGWVFAALMLVFVAPLIGIRENWAIRIALSPEK